MNLKRYITLTKKLNELKLQENIKSVNVDLNDLGEISIVIRLNEKINENN